MSFAADAAGVPADGTLAGDVASDAASVAHLAVLPERLLLGGLLLHAAEFLDVATHAAFGAHAGFRAVPRAMARQAAAVARALVGERDVLGRHADARGERCARGGGWSRNGGASNRAETPPRRLLADTCAAVDAAARRAVCRRSRGSRARGRSGTLDGHRCETDGSERRQRGEPPVNRRKTGSRAWWRRSTLPTRRARGARQNRRAGRQLSSLTPHRNARHQPVPHRQGRRPGARAARRPKSARSRRASRKNIFQPAARRWRPKISRRVASAPTPSPCLVRFH